MRGEGDVRQLLDAALSRVSDGEATAEYAWEQVLATRFGDNAITQSTSTVSEFVRVEVRSGSRRGSGVGSRLDPGSLAELVRSATEVARLSPEDPEAMPLPGLQAYPDGPPAFFDRPDRVGPEATADAVARTVDAAKGRGYVASGLFQATTRTSAIANTAGLWGFARETVADWSTTVHGPNGSAKAAQNRNDPGRLDVDALVRDAVEGAAAAQDPVELPPGDYAVILEPAAVAAMLSFLGFVLSARRAEEGSTAFTGAVGTRLVSDAVTLGLTLDDPELPAPRWGADGLALRPRTWIDRGEVQRLYHDRYWAGRKGVEADAAVFPLTMRGDDRSVDDLVRDCPRGLLVKNLWYIRFVDPRTFRLTGMTRDGVFLVEDGRVVGPVKNLRWNESPLDVLRQVTGLSRAVRVGGRSPAKVPAIACSAFTFTSTTESL